MSKQQLLALFIVERRLDATCSHVEKTSSVTCLFVDNFQRHQSLTVLRTLLECLLEILSRQTRILQRVLGHARDLE